MKTEWAFCLALSKTAQVFLNHILNFWSYWHWTLQLYPINCIWLFFWTIKFVIYVETTMLFQHHVSRWSSIYSELNVNMSTEMYFHKEATPAAVYLKGKQGFTWLGCVWLSFLLLSQSLFLSHEQIYTIVWSARKNASVILIFPSCNSSTLL